MEKPPREGRRGREGREGGGRERGKERMGEYVSIFKNHRPTASTSISLNSVAQTLAFFIHPLQKPSKSPAPKECTNIFLPFPRCLPLI